MFFIRLNFVTGAYFAPKTVRFFRHAEQSFNDGDPAGSVANRKQPPGQLDRITGPYPGTGSIFQLNIPVMYIWRIACFRRV